MPKQQLAPCPYVSMFLLLFVTLALALSQCPSPG